MTESLKSILRRRDDEEPPEVAAIKHFIMQRFNSTSSVSIGKNQVIIRVNSSALAGTLRMHIMELQKLVKPKTKLIIRIV